MKRFTMKKAAAAVQKVLDSARANKTMLVNGWTDDGDFLAADGYRVYRLYAEPEGITEQLGIHPADSSLVQKAKETVRKFLREPFSADCDYRLIDDECLPISPDRIRQNHTVVDGVKRYRLGPDGPTYNARYLIELLEMFPDALLYTDRKRGRLSPLYAHSPDHGDAILLPIRTW